MLAREGTRICLPSKRSKAKLYDRRAVRESSQAVHGTVIPKGSEISLMFAAANHDPAHYEDPENFDIERSNKDQLALGFGLHKCVGQYLARLEASAYFPRLLKKYPDYEVIESRWRLSHWARGYAALTIRA